MYTDTHPTTTMGIYICKWLISGSSLEIIELSSETDICDREDILDTEVIEISSEADSSPQKAHRSTAGSRYVGCTDYK